MVDAVANSVPEHVRTEYENLYRLKDVRDREMCIKYLLGRCTDSYCRHSHDRFNYDDHDIEYSDIVLDYGSLSFTYSLTSLLT